MSVQKQIILTPQKQRFHWGLSDKAWIFQTDAKHYDQLQRLNAHIRADVKNDNHELSNIYFNTLEKRSNDHLVDLFNIPILDISYTEDICNYTGLSLLLRSSYTIYTYIAVGSGSTTATPFDTALTTEVARVDFATQGFNELTGVQIRMAGTFPSSTVGFSPREMLVANQSSASGQTILSRNTPSTLNTHNQDADTLTCAEVVELVPII